MKTKFYYCRGQLFSFTPAAFTALQTRLQTLYQNSSSQEIEHFEQQLCHQLGLYKATSPFTKKEILTGLIAAEKTTLQPDYWQLLNRGLGLLFILGGLVLLAGIALTGLTGWEMVKPAMTPLVSLVNQAELTQITLLFTLLILLPITLILLAGLSLFFSKNWLSSLVVLSLIALWCGGLTLLVVKMVQLAATLLRSDLLSVPLLK